MNQSEIILIDKPKGITSFDVIRKLRKQLDKKKLGHAGTLDPLASGLMIVGVDGGTKKMDEYLKLPKQYITRILLGTKTDTGDLEGEVLEHVASVDISKRDIEKVMLRIVGKHTLPVPLYSAIKVDGKPLYKYARAGKTPPRIPEKIMEVIDAKLVGHDSAANTVEIVLDVSSGTYIRALAEWFGAELGLPATLSDLRRTRIGDFDIKDAQKLE